MEKQEQTKPVRGQNLLEWYEALISAALVLVLDRKSTRLNSSHNG